MDRLCCQRSNKLFDLSVCPGDLLLLARADSLGAIGQEPYVDFSDELAARLAYYEETMRAPFVQGRDLLEAGLAPGKDFSLILAFAHKLRLAAVPKREALRQTLAYAAKLREVSSP